MQQCNLEKLKKDFDKSFLDPLNSLPKLRILCVNHGKGGKLQKTLIKGALK